MKRAIVLSGGGSKGSYQVGVWKALRKLHIHYDIVTGTSIGALNGALMTQNTYLRARYIWHKLNLEYLFNQKPTSNKDRDVLKLFGRNFIQHGGMRLQKIERIIDKSISLRRFYQSNVNFGLVTYNVSSKSALTLTKKQIQKDHLTDYLMASATCFPAFQMKDIDGDKYIDGGVYDNLPINLALQMGADELIVVDLRAPGFKKRPKEKKPTIRIYPRNNISFFLNFNEKQAKENIQFGFNDTMKTFQMLDGNIFTFRKNTVRKLYRKYRKSMNQKLNKKLTEQQFLTILESLGRTFGLREATIYRTYTFKKQLQQHLTKQAPLSKELKSQLLSMQPKKIISTKVITLYFLHCLEKQSRIDKRLISLFFKNYEQAILLQQMGCYYGK